MNRSLAAFLLANLTVSAFLYLLTLLHPVGLSQRAVQVTIRSNVDAGTIVTAIEGLHRNDVDIHTYKGSLQPSGTPLMILPMMLGFTMITAAVFGIYKVYCRWLGIKPISNDRI
jgi:hypothetical protein